MSAAPFRVRLRLPSSKQETLTLPRPVTINHLLSGIQPFVNLEPAQIAIKIAYPSRVVDLGAPETWDRDVKEVGINNGEGLVVSENVGPTTTTTTAATGQTTAAMGQTTAATGHTTAAMGQINTVGSVSGGSTPVQKPSTPMQEPISVQPVKPGRATFANAFGNTASVAAEKRPSPSNLGPANAASPAKRSKGASVLDEPPEVEIEGGTIVLRIMEDDNSCMYHHLIPRFLYIYSPCLTEVGC